MSHAEGGSNPSSKGTSGSAFVVLLLVGVAVFTFGFTFLVLALSMDTTPPAPYLATTTDRLLLFVVSGVALVAGGALVRQAARVAGW